MTNKRGLPEGIYEQDGFYFAKIFRKVTPDRQGKDIHGPYRNTIAQAVEDWKEMIEERGGPLPTDHVMSKSRTVRLARRAAKKFMTSKKFREITAEETIL
tara:strand:- start:6103 stop:6402 length:300 start_codon:yes stop_codon:yes gene_type:complete